MAADAAGEADVCGICLETLPPTGADFSRFTCCGKGMHLACTEELQASAYRNKCPMCRAPVTTELENHRRALQWAKRGKAWAMHLIADDYRDGRGVQMSQKKARLWYGRAAEQGDAKSQYNLALMHHQGKGGPVSMEQARVWYGRAAEQGHAIAQYNLAFLHQNGQGGPVSMEQARVWYGRAAEQGHADAQYNLGGMHAKGHGGPVSLEHAIFWIKRAAVQGHNAAMHCVQQMKSMCSLCGKLRSASGENMKTCSGCKCAIYCSEVCQRAHWKKHGGHKTMCKKIQALHLKMAGGASGSPESAGGGAGRSKTNAGGGAAGARAEAAKTKKKKKKKKKKE